MNKKFVVGMFLLIVSILFSLSNIVITGNVVGSSNAVLSIIPLIAFLAGILLLYVSGLKIGSLEEIIVSTMAIKKDNVEPVIVFDTSGLIGYEDELGIIRGSEIREDTYIPSEVILELNKWKGRGTKKKNPLFQYLFKKDSDSDIPKPVIRVMNGKSKGVDPIIYGSAEKEAEKSLKESQKHKDYEIVRDALKDNTYNSLKGYPRIVLRNFLRDLYDNADMDLDKSQREEVIQELKKHQEVGSGDIGVLATSLYFAQQGKKVKLIARDKHIEQALDLLKDKYGYVSNIEYIRAPEKEKKTA